MTAQGFRIRIGTIYVLLLIWIACIVIIGVSHPLFLVGLVPPWFLGFVISKSTKVPADPTDVPFTPRIRLSYRDYDRWAEEMVRLQMGKPDFYSNSIPIYRKYSFALSGFDASLHIWAPTWCIVILAPLDILLMLFVFSTRLETYLSLSYERFLILGFLSALIFGHLGGWAAGLFYRWLRAKW